MNNSHPDWRLEGHYFETCNCEVACPCIWLQPPTEGNCKLLAAWHIDKGHLENVGLDNLSVALACYAPSTMIEGSWGAALYIDELADMAQTEAIIQIFSGRAGGHLSVLMGFVSEVWCVKSVAMDYQHSGDIHRLIIPGIAEAEIQSIQGIDGGDATIKNPPLCVVPSHASVVSKSNYFRYQDNAQAWNFSQRNGFHSPFIYQP
jgi:hypothetical protein